MKTITTILSIFALLLSTTVFSGVKSGIDPVVKPARPNVTQLNLTAEIDPVIKPARPNLTN
ncbi:MAG: hypothetical protein H7174_11540 [Flavobacterium sp.]|nr:hypothetical protein [Flavobacterium sp.]